MDQSVLNILIQFPLVAAFMWFALKVTSDQRAEIERLEKQWQSEIERIVDQWTQDIKRRDDEWREFTREQNVQWRGFIGDFWERSTQADDLVASRLAELANVLKSLSDDFKDHDRRANAK